MIRDDCSKDTVIKKKIHGSRFKERGGYDLRNCGESRLIETEVEKGKG
jgi:hypothetical protein